MIDRELLEEIGQASPQELRELLRTFHEKNEEIANLLREQLVDAKVDPRRGHSATPGGPRDTLVQKLARQKLLELYIEGTRPILGPLSLREIGDMYGVSGERVRRLFAKLCPLEYESHKRASPSNG